MIYICDKCSFTFKRVDPPEDGCPGCGSGNLREATEAECETFHEQQSKPPAQD